MGQRKEISVVLCTRNGERLIGDALQSLLDQSISPERFEIVVVDNGSTDGTKDLVSDFIDRHPGRVRLVEEPIAGLSRARNRGVRAARGDLLAFFDDDARAERQWLEALLPCFLDQRVGAAGGPIEPWWRTPPPPWWSAELDHLQSRLDHGPLRRSIRHPRLLYGSNLLVRRNVLEKTGLFREEMGRKGNNMAGGAEIELQLRILNQGHELIYEPAARVRHLAVERRAQIDYLKRKAYWHGRSKALCEILAAFKPSKPLPFLPLILLKGTLGSLLRHRLSLGSQYHLIFNWGYSVETLIQLIRPTKIEPPPKLEPGP